MFRRVWDILNKYIAEIVDQATEYYMYYKVLYYMHYKEIKVEYYSL